MTIHYNIFAIVTLLKDSIKVPYVVFRKEEDESSGGGKLRSKQTTGKIDPEANKLSWLQWTTNPGTDPHDASKESQE